MKNTIFRIVVIALLTAIFTLMIINTHPTTEQDNETTEVYQQIVVNIEDLEDYNTPVLEKGKVYVGNISMYGISVYSTSIAGNKSSICFSFSYFNEGISEELSIKKDNVNGTWFVETTDTTYYGDILLAIYELN